MLALSPAAGQTPKRGGILHAMQAEDLPAGFSIHETATIIGLWPVMPCYSNLVQSQELDPKKRLALVLDIQYRLEDDVAMSGPP